MRLPGRVRRSRPTRSSASSIRLLRLRSERAQAEADVLGDRQMGEQRAFLRDVAGRALVGRNVQSPRIGHDRCPRSTRCPLSAARNPIRRRSSVVLPLPDAPEDRRQRALWYREIDVGKNDGLRRKTWRGLCSDSSAIDQSSASERTCPKRRHEEVGRAEREHDEHAANGAAAANATVELLV